MKTISQILAELGVTHERSGDCLEHRLYFAGRFIGWYSAHQVGALIREHLPEEDETLKHAFLWPWLGI